MKPLVVAFIFLLFSVSPIVAETATNSASPSPTPTVLGLYDEAIDSTGSASVSATPRPATPSARTTTYLDPSTAPVSGAVENTIIMLSLGLAFIIAGFKLSQN